MEESDSLLLSRNQVDSLWKATATTLAASGDEYDVDAAMHLQIRLSPWVVASLKQAIGRKSVGIRMFMY